MYTFGFSWKIWKSPKVRLATLTYYQDAYYSVYPSITVILFQPISPGEDILAYLTEAAEEQNIMGKIRFNVNVDSASWDSGDNMWHLVTSSGERYSCNMLIGCSGYFSYENPYEPKFPGNYVHDESYMSAVCCGSTQMISDGKHNIAGQYHFAGKIVHPQKWTLEYDQMIKGKRVALIGSGATAITIVPGIKVYKN